MKCPKCNSKTKTVDSRAHSHGLQVKRRKLCVREECGNRFNSFEINEDALDMMEKKAKTRLINKIKLSLEE
jgi:transcriptional regulator NrdR family protein